MEIVINYNENDHHSCRVKNAEDIWGNFRVKPTELRKFDPKIKKQIAIALYKIAMSIDPQRTSAGFKKFY